MGIERRVLHSAAACSALPTLRLRCMYMKYGSWKHTSLLLVVLFVSYPGSRILVDGVQPVGVAVSNMDVMKARVPQNCVNVFTGDLNAYIQHIAEQWSAENDWILEFEPVNGMRRCVCRCLLVVLHIGLCNNHLVGKSYCQAQLIVLLGDCVCCSFWNSIVIEFQDFCPH